MILAVCLALLTGGWNGPHESGWVKSVSYSEGSANPKTYESICFSGNWTRRETRVGEDLVSIDVTGKSPWSAYPAARRLYAVPRMQEAVELGAQLKGRFDAIFAKRSQREDVRFEGRPAWRYAWHENELRSGDVVQPPQDVEYWVNADESFPIVLGYHSSLGNRMQVTDLQLGRPVDEKLFQQPPDLQSVIPFSLPKEPFRITLQRTFQFKDGTPSQDTERFAGNGSTVVIMSLAAGSKREMSYEEATGELWRDLQTPYWPGVKRKEKSSVLGIRVDRLVSVWRGVDNDWFVGDHAKLGTVTLKRVDRAPDSVHTMQVIQVEFGK